MPEPDESSRLLSAESALQVPSPSSSPSASPSRPPFSAPVRPQIWRIIFIVIAVSVALNVGNYISWAAQTVLLQDIICRNYYDLASPGAGDHLVDRCKAEPVQSEIAYINGWKDVFEMLPSVLLAVPYGTLADRIGRKKVLIIAMIGVFMNDLWVRIVYWFPNVFPLRTVWYGGLWQILGAGGATLSSLTHVMVADVCPPDQRTTAFSQMQSAMLLAELIFVPLGGALSSVTPWLPLLISSVLAVLSITTAIYFLPETLPFAATSEDRHTTPTGEWGGDVKNDIYSRIKKLIEAGSWAKKSIRVLVVVTCFATYSLGAQARGSSILLQYVSKRLGWSIGQATYLVSLGSGVNLAVHALFIPALSTFFLLRLRLHEMAKDKRLAQLSSLFLIAGASTIFFATSWFAMVAGQVLSAFGAAFLIPVRSVATSMVGQEHFAALYTGISVMTYAGLLTGGPLFAETFRWGMRLGNFWTGMPYLVAAGFFILASLAVSSASERPVEGSCVYSDHVEEQLESGGL